MQPKAAIFFFLLAAGILAAIMLPSRGQARRGAEPASECSLGSCPLVLTTLDRGRSLNYPLGTKFTIVGLTEKPEINCAPEGAVLLSAFAPLGGVQFAAEKRGTCILTAGTFRAAVNVSRFR